jgi:hypothetical protein
MQKRNSIVRHRNYRESQTVLRAVQGAAIVLAATLLTSPAAAEVCDKVAGDNWRPEQAQWLLALPVGLEMAAFAGVLALAMFLKERWLCFLGAAFAAIRSLSVAGWIFEDDIYSAAVSEGCASLRVDLAHIGVLIALGLVCTWFGFRPRRQHAEAH